MAKFQNDDLTRVSELLMFGGVLWVPSGFFEASDIQSCGYQAMTDF